MVDDYQLNNLKSVDDTPAISKAGAHIEYEEESLTPSIKSKDAYSDNISGEKKVFSQNL